MHSSNVKPSVTLNKYSCFSAVSLFNLVSTVSETLWILSNTSDIRLLCTCCAWVKASNVTGNVTSDIDLIILTYIYSILFLKKFLNISKLIYGENVWKIWFNDKNLKWYLVIEHIRREFGFYCSSFPCSCSRGWKISFRCWYMYLLTLSVILQRRCWLFCISRG